MESSVSTSLGAGVENGVLLGSANINLTGNALANTLTGNGGENTVTGAEGNDVIVGSGGTDQLVGGIGDDTYVPSSVDQTLAENADEGIDTVSFADFGQPVTLSLGANIENATGSAYADTLTGNTLANAIVGGGGNDTLDGAAGVDQIAGGAGMTRLLSMRLATSFPEDRVLTPFGRPHRSYSALMLRTAFCLARVHSASPETTCQMC